MGLPTICMKFPWKRSLGTRLFVYVMGGAVLAIGSLSLVFYRVVEEQAINDIQDKLDTEVRLIENQLVEAERTGLGLAIAISNLKKQGITDPKIYEDLVLQNHLNLPPLAMGIGFGQTPYGILGDRQWYWPYFYLDQGVEGQVGKQLPPPNDNIRFAELFQDDNYPRQDYYTLLAENGEAQWMNPYLWYVLTMTTYLVPIRDQNQNLIGMTGIDVNVTTISQAIDHPVIKGGGYFFILSKQGNVLAYPPDPTKAESLSTSAEIPEIDAFFQYINGKEETFFKLNHRYWTYQKVKGTDWMIVATVPQSLIFFPVFRITLYATLGAGIIFASIIFLFIRRLNQRLQPILEECQSILLTEKLDDQDEFLLPRRSPEEDEIQILAKSVKQTTYQLQIALEQTRILNQSLERFVPKEFLKFLGRKSLSEIQLGDQVEDYLSVLFTDIRNFTYMSEAMSPEENFQFINDYFGCISPAVRENHGFIDKYIGDALMALFDAPADNAVQAGLDILKRLQDFNQQRNMAGLPLIEIGIGINTGGLMIGTVGEANRMDNTVISDAVNVAARIEQLTKTYQVSLLISQETLDHLSDSSAYAIRMIEQVKVRGKSKPIIIYEVFDGDRPELKAKKIATQPLFEQAVHHYQLCLFAEAEQLFQTCLAQNFEDQVVKIYIDRCQQKLYRFKVSILENSFQKIRGNFVEVAATFYEKLFEDFPHFKNLFSETDIVKQQIKFAHMIELMIDSLRDYEAVRKILKDLGKKHTNYGVIAQYYPMLQETLLTSLALYLGEDWTPEVAQAWEEAYRLVQEIMLSSVQITPAAIADNPWTSFCTAIATPLAIAESPKAWIE